MNNKQNIEEYLNDAEASKSNANLNFSHSGLKSYISDSVLKEYSCDIFGKFGELHRNGAMYLHNLDGGPYTPYCSGHSLENLLLKGLVNPVGISSQSAKHFDVAVDHIVNFTYMMTQEFSGAQAFNDIDILLAPYIYYDQLEYKEVKQVIQRLVWNLSFPLRSGFQSVFLNFSLGLRPSKYYDNKLIVHPKQEDKTYQDFQPQIDMFNKALLETLIEGADGYPFTFPLPTYKITKDFQWNSEISNLIFKLAATWGTPYFSNYLNTDFNEDDALSMCCRLKLNVKEIQKVSGGLWSFGNNTGSLAVCTLNMAQLGYLMKGDEKAFYLRLDALLEEAKQYLLLKKTYVLKGIDIGLYPMVKNYIGKKIGSTYFLTIGINGLNECSINFCGKNIVENSEWCENILKHIKAKTLEFQQESGQLFNFEATPAEGCISSETIIKTIEGDIPIKDLVGKDGIGVYSYDEKTKKVCIKKANKIRKTRSNAKVIKITFDHGGFIICTPDHPIAKRSENRWGKPTIKFVEAKDLEIGNSIKSLNYEKSKGYIFLNGKKRSHIHYEFFNNDIFKENEKIHHIDRNKINDSKENLIKLNDSEHKKLHGIEDKSWLNMLHGYGKDNNFFGKHHTEEAKEKNRQAHLGKNTGDLNSSKRPEVRKKLSIIAKNKPKEKHSHYRNDIKTEDIIKMYNEGYTYKEISEKFNCTHGLIQSRKKEANHKVTKIEYLDELMDVYNMEVEDTECYFAADGILIHNCSHTLAKLDKKNHPDMFIQGNDSSVYYTGSSFCPHNLKMQLSEAIRHQEKLQQHYTGGTVFHIDNGDINTSSESVKKIIKAICTKTTLPYITWSPTYRTCKIHGKTNGKEPCCDKGEVMSRIVGFYRPISRWNAGKLAEFKSKQFL